MTQSTIELKLQTPIWELAYRLALWTTFSTLLCLSSALYAGIDASRLVPYDVPIHVMVFAGAGIFIVRLATLAWKQWNAKRSRITLESSNVTYVSWRVATDLICGSFGALGLLWGYGIAAVILDFKSLQPIHVATVVQGISGTLAWGLLAYLVLRLRPPLQLRGKALSAVIPSDGEQL